MVNSCSAYGCKNRNSKGSQITFHRFPLNNKSLLKLWLYQIKRGNWEPSKYSVICSEHFTEDCFVVKGLQNSRRTLKSDAYPTIFSMAIYSEPPKKKTFPARKSVEDVPMNEDSKEESASASESTKEENMSVNDGTEEENMSVNEGTKEENASKDDVKDDDDDDAENEGTKKENEEESGKASEEMEETPVNANSDVADI